MIRHFTAIIFGLTIMIGPALANDKPSAFFCWMAKGAVVEAGGEAAAEKAARAKGVSEADIAKAKRCKR
jgi:hypothetical protein